MSSARPDIAPVVQQRIQEHLCGVPSRTSDSARDSWQLVTDCWIGQWASESNIKIFIVVGKLNRGGEGPTWDVPSERRKPAATPASRQQSSVNFPSIIGGAVTRYAAMEGAVSTDCELLSGPTQKLSAENARTEPRMCILYLTKAGDRNRVFSARKQKFDKNLINLPIIQQT